MVIVEPVAGPPPQKYNAAVMTAVSRYYRHNFGTIIPSGMSFDDQLKLYASFSPGFLNQYGTAKASNKQAPPIQARSTAGIPPPIKTPGKSKIIPDKEDDDVVKSRLSSKSKKRSKGRDSDGESNKSDSTKSSESKISTSSFYEPSHGQWYDHPLFRLSVARSNLTSAKQRKKSKSATKVYNVLHKKAHQQSLPVLKHNANQVRWAAEYRQWIAGMHHVLVHNHHGKGILDPETYEVNRELALPLSTLEGIAYFLLSKISD